ncbi:hypothetical protein LguiA_031192 [Lonicera macranthoides]
MAPTNLHNQFKADATAAATTTAAAKHKKISMAKRALRSLSVALMVPLALTMATIFFFGSARKYRALAKPFWFPPPWLMHLASLGSSFFMGLSSWLVWAEGGFHNESDALPLYIAQLSLSIIWDPLVLKIGAVRMGLVFCVVHFGTLVACRRKFKTVNPIAGDLVRPCLAWIAFLTTVNCKLIFL